jgi:hypothetical protein
MKKWTEEEITTVINLHGIKTPLKQIAETIGCTYDQLCYIVRKLISEGKLVSYRSNPSIYTKEQLIDFIQEYKSRDACPNPIRHAINKMFGSWSKGLEAASMTSNIGGLVDPSKPLMLYLLQFDGFYKIGVTQRTLQQRFSGAPHYEVIDTYCSDLDEVLSLEKEILSKVERVLPEHPWFKRNGKTECFKSDKKLNSLLDLI